MFQRILVPLDGSESAERILPAVEALLRADKARAILVRAVHCPLSKHPHFTAVMGELEQAAQRHLSEIEGRLRGSGFAVEKRVVHGDPAPTIVTLARDESCDLIAMTARGRNAVARFLVGSIAEKVVRGSAVPVLVVRPPDAPATSKPTRPFQRLLVPLDGSGISEAALAPAAGLAKQFGSSVTLLHAVEPMELEAHLMALMPVEEQVAEARKKLDEDARGLKAKGVDATIVVRKGRAAEEILAFTAENAVDLVCMATHGRSGPARWLLGSVAERVLRHSTAPLLLVPTPNA